MSLAAEKVEQAVGILNEIEVDAWLTFVRETTETGDPVLPIILGQSLTWQSALIVTRGGDRIAIVGKYEDEAVRSTGAWSEVVPYVKGIRAPLLETLTRLDPAKIAVNYSLGDVKADGLSHGMYRLLGEHLAGTPYAERLVSAERIVAAVRGRKTAGELERIRQAIATTNTIFESVAGFAEPGRREAEISRFMHAAADSCGVGLAWDAGQCPIVTTGPDSMVGHGVPSEDLAVTPGNIFHLDFGVMESGYCSDVQRAWYVPSDEQREPSPRITAVFDAVRASIEAAFATLRPGVEGWRVDEAARTTLVKAGYPEYQHATGHEVGRAAHDGGTVLGPKWERYGDTPNRTAQPGNVFTLELGVEDTGHGYLGLEEMVVVTESGAEYLTKPQTKLAILGEPWARVC